MDEALLKRARERRLLRRREEAQRDPADGGARAAARHPRRDRLRPRHRRAAHRRRRREHAARAGARDDRRSPTTSGCSTTSCPTRARAGRRPHRASGGKELALELEEKRLRRRARSECRSGRAMREPDHGAGPTRHRAVAGLRRSVRRRAEPLPGAGCATAAGRASRASPRWASRRRRDEDWKYTNVAPIGERAVRAGAARPHRRSTRSRRISLGGRTARRLIFVNGHVAPELSATCGACRAGVRVMTPGRGAARPSREPGRSGAGRRPRTTARSRRSTPRFLADGALDRARRRRRRRASRSSCCS